MRSPRSIAYRHMTMPCEIKERTFKPSDVPDSHVDLARTAMREALKPEPGCAKCNLSTTRPNAVCRKHSAERRRALEEQSDAD